MRSKHFEDIFELVYEKNYPSIYRYIFRFVGNQEDANQIVQQTFMNFYKYLSTHHSINNSRAMVFKIANNICYDYLRRKQRIKNVSSADLVSINTVEPPEDTLLKDERNEIFLNALKRLSLKDQQCVLLYHEGLSYTEISNCLRIKKNSVGKVLSRAIEKLARIIKSGEKSCGV